MVHIYSGILLSHKRNAPESVLMRWMKLEPIIQSEVSQKEKYKYHILTHTYIYMESEEMTLMYLFSGQQWRNRHREQTYGRVGGGMRCMERVTGNLTLTYVK